MRLPSIRPAARRGTRAHVACVLLAAAALAGCSAAPPLRWVQLPIDPSAPRSAPGLPAQASEPARGGAVPIHLMPVRLPEMLDRDELLVPQGPAGLAPLSGWRWAEPLREAVPRLLRDDLARALGESRVWTSPLPAGLGRVQPLRVEVVLMQAEPQARGVRLRARWSLGDATPDRAPRGGVFDLSVPSRTEGPFAGEPAQALAQAHRDALAALAAALADEVGR